MSAYFFNEIPVCYISDFVAVRDPYSNLENLLNVVEAINCCPTSRTTNNIIFDFALFTGDVNRVLIRKADGFFTMAMPFQIIDYGANIVFIYDEYNLTIDSAFISYMKNAINTCREGAYSYDNVVYSLHESFGMEFSEVILYSDVLSSLLLKDHGYFRFDDDPTNQNARIHPRYHFDFFCTNSTGVKIGVSNNITSSFFIDLFDLNKNRPYIA